MLGVWLRSTVSHDTSVCTYRCACPTKAPPHTIKRMPCSFLYFRDEETEIQVTCDLFQVVRKLSISKPIRFLVTTVLRGQNPHLITAGCHGNDAQGHKGPASQIGKQFQNPRAPRLQADPVPLINVWLRELARLPHSLPSKMKCFQHTFSTLTALEIPMDHPLSPPLCLHPVLSTPNPSHCMTSPLTGYVKQEPRPESTPAAPTTESR